MFGSGLAALDGNTMDPELFYIASLLHDYGLTEVVPGEDFTLRSAERVIRCADEAALVTKLTVLHGNSQQLTGNGACSTGASSRP